jgi:hypothetical protein
MQAAPGGSFSSGQLQDVPFAGLGGSLQASLDSLAQLRLIPSANAKLPATGQIGDLYVNIQEPTGARFAIVIACICACNRATAGDVPRCGRDFHWVRPNKGGKKGKGMPDPEPELQNRGIFNVGRRR